MNIGEEISFEKQAERVKSNFLIIDDEAPLLEMAALALARDANQLWTASDIDEARKIIDSQPVEIAITDLNLKRENEGIELLDELVPRAPDIAVVIMTGNHDVQTAINCLRNGAFDYLLKPFSVKELQTVARRVAERRMAMIRQRTRIEEQIRILSMFPSENPYPVMRVSIDGTLLYANAASLELLKEWHCDIGNKVPPFLQQFIKEVVEKDRRQDIEVESIGRVFSFTATPIKGADYVYIYGHDITRLKETERELIQVKNQAQEMALHDALTGLPNRILLEDRLAQAISYSLRTNTKTALAFVDVDNFKNINDTFGHKVGDQVLVRLGNYLKEAVRKTDTVARWGGDELIILLTGLHNRAEAQIVCERIRRTTQEKLRADNLGIPVTVSMGVALCPDDSQSPHLLEQQADIALYAAKQSGRNITVFFSETNQVKLFQQKLNLSNMLGGAIESGKIIPHYQPIVKANSGNVVAVESLARWYEPELGWIPPSTFIPLAEESGLIDQLGAKIIERSIKDLKTFHTQGLKLNVNINTSVRQLYAPNFLDNLIALIQNNGLETKWVTLEITESQALSGVFKKGNPLYEAAQAGFRISIDDFGQGYSSLSSLQDLPVHELKIDMKFIRNASTDKGRRILQAIIELARILELDSVAEGVEDKAEFELLTSMGVTKLQGYYISHPMPLEEIPGFVKSRTREAVQQ